MKKTFLFLLMGVCMLAGLSFGVGLDTSDIPADAKWVLHSDFDAFFRSEFGGLVLGGIDEEVQKKIDAADNLLGCDVTRDIFGVTVYGDGSGSEGCVVIVHGKYDNGKIISLLVLNDEYKETSYGDHTLHHWVDGQDDEMKVGVFEDGMSIVSISEEAVKKALDVMSDKADSISDVGGGIMDELTQAPENALVVLVAENLSELNTGSEHAAVLKNSKLASAVIVEENGYMYLGVNLMAKSAKAALQIENVLNGIKSLVELEGEGVPQVTALLNKLVIRREGDKLMINAGVRSEKIFEVLKSIRDVSNIDKERLNQLRMSLSQEAKVNLY